MKHSRFCVPFVVVIALSLTALSFAQEEGQQGRRGQRGGQRAGQQGPRFGFGGFGGFTRGITKVTLLGAPKVRKELKIGEEQAAKIDEVLAAHREAQRELMASMRSRDGESEDRQARREAFAKKMGELNAKTEKKLMATLEKEQAERLNGIALQQQGIDGLVAEGVVASLKLSKEQVAKIKGLLETRDEKTRELMGGFRRGRGGENGEGGDRPNFQEIREKSQAIREDTEKQVMAVLSEEQTAALAKLKGEAFEIDRRELFPRRGGRDGAGAAGGRRGGQGAGQRRRPPADEEI